LYNELRDRISSGVYPPGTALPSEARMREEFGVSLITIRRAIHELSLDGLVDSRQGIGSFVRECGRDSVVVSMSSFTSDVAAGRLRLIRTLMADELVPATSDVADKLNVPTGSMLRHFVRLDSEGEVPLSVDEVFMRPSLANEITPEIAASPLFMHLWQQASGISLVKTNYEIHVKSPDEDDREILQIGAETPILVTAELIFDPSDRPSAWIETRYRGDRSRLSASMTLVQRQTEKGIIGE
jgi:DNA-binding GntR family transcriptional regulator